MIWDLGLRDLAFRDSGIRDLGFGVSVLGFGVAKRLWASDLACRVWVGGWLSWLCQFSPVWRNGGNWNPK